MDTTWKRIELNLHLFDGAGGAGGTGGAGAAGADGGAPAGGDGNAAMEAARAMADKRTARNPLADVKYGKQPDEGAKAQESTGQPPAKAADVQVTEAGAEARKAEFEKLIKGDYKDLFDARVQQILGERFKGVKDLEAKMASLSPVLDMLAGKYGTKANDVEGLARAIEDDSTLYEDEAVKRGMSVEQFKAIRKMERENEQLRRTIEERERIENGNRVYAEWTQQAEKLAQMYPAFDLAGECNHPETGNQFLSLLKSGVPLRTAYEVIHRDEILGGAMRYTAERVQKKTIDDIRARGMRPEENGAGGRASAEVKTDVRKLTPADRREIERRVARGERITFGP